MKLFRDCFYCEGCMVRVPLVILAIGGYRNDMQSLLMISNCIKQLLTNFFFS